MVKFFFKALGWQLLTDEAKDVAFDSKFQALGVEFDLTDMQHGFFTVGNTSSRKTELCATIDSIIAADCLTMGEATSFEILVLALVRRCSGFWPFCQSRSS